MKLPTLIHRDEFPANTITQAKWLLGKLVVRHTGAGLMIGRIVETEAYLHDDEAAHSFRGMTPRNRSLFLEKGHAYVYIAYGVSMMLNVSAGKEGVGTGVLIRALDPVSGIELMEKNRGIAKLRDLTRGPGRLAQAFAIDLSLQGLDLCRKGELWLAKDVHKVGKIGASKRIGITKNAEPLLRFFVKDNPFVSGPKALNG
ncbi:MAG: DNA-3-methyladenine glycosylase [Rhodospirillaceae bacterium]|nr:DNA-3-methyladenine glycosylase [Rhodospirillaceae bacterium]